MSAKTTVARKFEVVKKKPGKPVNIPSAPRTKPSDREILTLFKNAPRDPGLPAEGKFAHGAIRCFQVEHEGSTRILEIHRHSIAWIIADRMNPEKTILGLRNRGARPIPVNGKQEDISPWWRAGFPDAVPAKAGAK